MNIPHSLAIKNQFMLAYHTDSSFHTFQTFYTSLEVTDVSFMPVDVLNEGVFTVLKQKYPHTYPHLLAVFIMVRGSFF